jgi:hypothetical protein
MVRRWVVPVAIAMALGSVGAAGAAMASTSQHVTETARQFVAGNLPPGAPGGPIQTAPGTRPAVADGHLIQFSNNWSGYAVPSGTFTKVSGSWTQPAITCTSGDGSTDMSPWVGIDGDGTSTVEQTGSSGDCNGTQAIYYGWYEMFPRGAIILSKTVKPGDQFTATVTHLGGEKYRLLLTDKTEGWTNNVVQKLSGTTNSTAEAIMEEAAPGLTRWSGPDPFSAIMVNGKPIGSFAKTQQMEIKDGSTLCDTISSLTSQRDFTATWDHICHGHNQVTRRP